MFPDPAMTLAAVDWLVHHAVIFEMNVRAVARQKPRICSDSKRDSKPQEVNNTRTA